MGKKNAIQIEGTVYDVVDPSVKVKLYDRKKFILVQEHVVHDFKRNGLWIVKFLRLKLNRWYYVETTREFGPPWSRTTESSYRAVKL